MIFHSEPQSTRQQSFQELVKLVAESTRKYYQRDENAYLSLADEDRLSANLFLAWAAMNPNTPDPQLLSEFYEWSDGLRDSGSMAQDMPRLSSAIGRYCRADEYGWVLNCLGEYSEADWLAAHEPVNGQMSELDLCTWRAYQEKRLVYSYLDDSDPDGAFRRFAMDMCEGKIELEGWGYWFDATSDYGVYATDGQNLGSWDELESKVSAIGQEFRPIVGHNHHGPDGLSPHQRSIGLTAEQARALRG